jgi:hypothetical protein
MWGPLSDERTSISFTVYSVNYSYILHVMTLMYIQYIQGFCQSRLSTADYAVSFLQDNSSARAISKTPFFYCCARVRFRGNVFTEPLLRNGLHNPVVIFLRTCMSRASPSNGRCLQSHRLATGLYSTVSKQIGS